MSGDHTVSRATAELQAALERVVGGPPTPYPRRRSSPPPTANREQSGKASYSGKSPADIHPSFRPILSYEVPLNLHHHQHTADNSSDFPPLPGQSSNPPSPTVPAPSSWKDKTAQGIRTSYKLQFNPDAKMVEGKLLIPRSMSLKDQSFSSCLVGYTLGKRFGFSYMRDSVERLWGKMGLKAVQANEEGVYLFRFDTVQDCLNVLEGGPWHVGSKPLMIKQWTPMLNMSKVNHKRIPVWIKLYNLPIELWDEESLSYVCSIFSKPLCADRQTKERARISFARACVEIDTETSIPNQLTICDEEGEEVVIHIEVPPLPIKCSSCKVFGHNCNAVTKVWRPKTQDNNNTTAQAQQENQNNNAGLEHPPQEPNLQEETATTNWRTISKPGSGVKNHMPLIDQLMACSTPTIGHPTKFQCLEGIEEKEEEEAAHLDSDDDIRADPSMSMYCDSLLQSPGTVGYASDTHGFTPTATPSMATLESGTQIVPTLSIPNTLPSEVYSLEGAIVGLEEIKEHILQDTEEEEEGFTPVSYKKKHKFKGSEGNSQQSRRSPTQLNPRARNSPRGRR